MELVAGSPAELADLATAADESAPRYAAPLPVGRGVPNEERIPYLPRRLATTSTLAAAFSHETARSPRHPSPLWRYPRSALRPWKALRRRPPGPLSSAHGGRICYHENAGLVAAGRHPSQEPVVTAGIPSSVTIFGIRAASNGNTRRRRMLVIEKHLAPEFEGNQRPQLKIEISPSSVQFQKAFYIRRVEYSAPLASVRE